MATMCHLALCRGAYHQRWLITRVKPVVKALRMAGTFGSNRSADRQTQSCDADSRPVKPEKPLAEDRHTGMSGCQSRSGGREASRPIRCSRNTNCGEAARGLQAARVLFALCLLTHPVSLGGAVVVSGGFATSGPSANLGHTDFQPIVGESFFESAGPADIRAFSRWPEPVPQFAPPELSDSESATALLFVLAVAAILPVALLWQSWRLGRDVGADLPEHE